jgi:hypothetical protein
MDESRGEITMKSLRYHRVKLGAIALAAGGLVAALLVPTLNASSQSAVNPEGFVGVSPTRVLDTRVPPIGVAAAGPVGPGVTVDLPFTSPAPNRPSVPVPAGAVSVLLNVTVDFDATAESFITVWPTGIPRPTTSVINPKPGTVVSGSILVPLGAGGSVSFFNFAGNVNLIVDLAGYTMPLSGTGGAPGPQGPPGPPGPGAGTPVHSLSTAPWSATNSSVALTADGVAFGPYPDGGAAGGSIQYSGLDGQPLSAITSLTYYMRYVADSATGGVGAPYLRVFTEAGTHDIIFSPNTQTPDPDVAEGPFHEWVGTSGTWRYDDDPGSGGQYGNGAPLSQVIADHGTESISGIFISTGFSLGTNLAALLRWTEINGERFVFAS